LPLQIGTDLLTSFPKVDDLERLGPQKLKVLLNFSRFYAITHISRVNCTEIFGGKPRQPAHKIFSTDRKF